MARERSRRSTRKWCKVYIDTPEGRKRCDCKIKPGTPFCKEHFLTHKLVEVKCNGEAHGNPYIDHCGVCMPFWGRYPVAVLKTDNTLPDWNKDSW